MAGAAAVATTVVASVLLPRIIPDSLQQSPILYPAVIVGAGVAAGIGLQKWGHPIAAIGIGIPLLVLGGFAGYLGIMAKLSAPPPTKNGGRGQLSFRDAYQQRSGPTMGALASYTPRSLGMGAVLQSSGYSTMAAVEAMVGDRSMRPAYYTRAGNELGAR